jgi:hypothetical protein
MNLNATPETVRAVAEMFKLAAFLDDRVAQPDKARLAAWSEQLERHHLTEGDMLDGVQEFYDTPSSRPIGVGDLIHHARAAKHARREVERQAELAAYESTIDRKAADEFAALVGEYVSGPVKFRTERLTAAEAALQAAWNRDTAHEALREYFAAKAEATKKAS